MIDMDDDTGLFEQFLSGHGLPDPARQMIYLFTAVWWEMAEVMQGQHDRSLIWLHHLHSSD